MKYLIIILALIIPQMAVARIGYTYEQCVTKYGKPTHKKEGKRGLRLVVWPGKDRMYDSLWVEFLNGKVDRIAIQLENHGKAEEVWRGFVRANLGDKDWKQVDKNQELFEHIGDTHVYGALVSGRGNLRWRCQTTDKKMFISCYIIGQGYKSLYFIDTVEILKFGKLYDIDQEAAAKRKLENSTKKAVFSF